MKTVLMGLMLWFAVAGAQAQSTMTAPTDKSADANMRPAQVPAGTQFAAELSKSIDAHKAKVGDPVVARTTQDMLANGKVVIPHDSKITGHVTEVQGRPKGQKGEANSTVGIAFDQLMIKGGEDMPLHANIQAIAKPLEVVPGAPGTQAASGGYGGSPTVGSGYPGQNPAAAPGTVPASVPNPAGGSRDPENTANNAAGYPSALSVGSQGVVGMKGLALSANDQGSVISSTSENVKLEGGTQLILKTKDK
jgi:hypothetical protein